MGLFSTAMSVLVLNQNYEPINVCPVRRAVVLIYRGKAEMLENGRGELHTATAIIPMPSVIRLSSMVRRPPVRRKLTRREIFMRDRHTCQYCGKEGKELTVDHVIPRFRGGQHLWENVAAACIPCNHRKAGCTPQEAGMHLLRKPKAPPLNPYHFFTQHLASHEEWRKFIII